VSENPPRPPSEAEIATGIPKANQLPGDFDTRQMVFELQGTVHEIREVLRSLEPKIDDLAGFVKYRAPHLADKADLIRLEAEIQKRPTR
jgi:hypothetical protein